MKQLKTTQIVLWMLLSVPFVSLKAQQSLWVGEEYQCFLTDYANTSLSILNVSWTVPSEMKEEFSGTYVRTVSFSQYQSGTYSVRASWKETDMSDSFSPFYSKSHTWSFTCRDNPLVLNNSSLTLTKGSTGTIGYSHTYSNEYTSLAKVTYSSSNSSVASVSSTGVVTAKSAGTATITVTSTIAKDPKTCTVTVKSTPSGIQFADAKVKALCVANWDTNGDGELSEAEAAAITDLGEVFSENTEITSFNELQYFTGLTSIGEGSFSDCSSLTSISIPNSVTSIGSYAFRDCICLTYVTIPSSVKTIDERPFYGCGIYVDLIVHITDLTAWCKINFTLGLGLEYRKYRLFLNGKEIKDLIIPDGVASISSSAFEHCSLTSVTIPESVTSIGSFAFSDCTGLTSITIGNSVTSIGNYAFYKCSGLTSIDFGNSLTSFGHDAFSGTAWYNNQPDGMVYAGKVAYKYKGTMPEGTEIVITDGTLGIANYAFEDCRGLTSVTIPESVTSIGSFAFSDCTGLTSITIGNSVTSIGNYAFYKCSGLTSIDFGNSLTSFGHDAFSGTAWYNNQPDGMVYAGKVAYKYKGTMPEGTEIVITDGTLGIANYAFEDCRGLTSVTIPNSVTSIGSSAFGNCI